MKLDKSLLKAVVLLSLIVLLTACMSVPRHKVHYTVINDGDSYSPKKVVLLPMYVMVRKLTTGGVLEGMREWEASAKKNLRKAINDYTTKSNEFTYIELPQISNEESTRIREHIALFNRVGGAALSIPAESAWREKHKRFDYTLGPGLEFLKNKTNADAAIIVFARDIVSSGGRKAVAIAGFLLAGAFIPLGYSKVSMGIIDLKTGNILWANQVNSNSLTFRKPEEAELMISNIMTVYPGIKEYQEIIKN